MPPPPSLHPHRFAGRPIRLFNDVRTGLVEHEHLSEPELLPEKLLAHLQLKNGRRYSLVSQSVSYSRRSSSQSRVSFVEQGWTHDLSRVRRTPQHVDLTSSFFCIVLVLFLLVFFLRGMYIRYQR